MKIADSHNDFLTHFEGIDEIDRYIQNLRGEPIHLLSCAVWTTEFENPIERIKILSDCLKNRNGGINLLLSIEDLFFADMTNINEIIKLKPISCSLTWNFDNNLAGGNCGQKGLTELGRNIVSELEKNNILIDTAHLNRKSFYDLSEITTKPLYNSHCCIDAVCHHKRNLTDKQIEKTIASGGYIGLCFVGKFLSKNKTVTAKDVALHFDYVIKNFSFQNIGFGTDFYGTSDLPLDVANYSQIENVLNQLRAMGHSEEIIQHIAYKNFENFLRRNNLLS